MSDGLQAAALLPSFRLFYEAPVMESDLELCQRRC